MLTEDLFFELIRVAIGTQHSLSETPSETEWRKLYAMARKQSLLGVCFAGVSELINSETGDYAGMSTELYYEWAGMALQIQLKNEVVNGQCVKLQKKLSDAGFRSSILKGQGNISNYGSIGMFRQSGDIDVYVDCGRTRAIEYAKTMQKDVDWDYKHLHLKVFPNTEVEMHYVPEVLLNLRKNRKLQKWFKEHQEEMFTENGQLISPNLEFNLFYILLHIYRHFLYEGVGMRQLMDYYFVLINPAVVPAMRDGTMAAVKSFGMGRFVAGLMWMMRKVFGMSEELQLCEPDETEGRFILSEVMSGGNFGHYDKRLGKNTKGRFGAVEKILKHNFHLWVHYPADTLWTPIWIVYHWCWKRMNRV